MWKIYNYLRTHDADNNIIILISHTHTPARGFISHQLIKQLAKRFWHTARNCIIVTIVHINV